MSVGDEAPQHPLAVNVDDADADAVQEEKGISSTFGLEVKKSPGESCLDPRVTVTARPDGELDENLRTRIDHVLVPHHEDDYGRSSGKEEGQSSATSEPVYIEFEAGDKRNPQNFSLAVKWSITALGSANAGSYNMGFSTMIPDLGCTEFQATLGLSLYALGFGLVPLVSASFSEEFGRQPLYVVSSLGFMMMYVMIAKARNIETVLVARFLQGGFGSTGSTMVGGTVADIWRPDQRGLPMALFALTAIGGTGLGPLYGGWIQMNEKLGWRWIQWIQMIDAGLMFVLIPIVMKETRAPIILTRLARRIRKETGDTRFRARIEDERAKLSTLIYVSCTRPIHLMFTEPVVASFSLWVGFAWGILYCMIESIPLIFRELHGFNIGQIGTAFVAMIIGTTIGSATNFIQERLYQKRYPHRGPEARLYFACFAAVLFPIGMFIYAWTSLAHVSWVGVAMGVVVFTWACYIIYLAVFSYLADCYGPFASSALAGQSLCRNLLGFAFPLFTPTMFRNLTYKWSSTLFACLASVMIPIPFQVFESRDREWKELESLGDVIVENESWRISMSRTNVDSYTKGTGGENGLTTQQEDPRYR
ncbi:MFS general substrate transporter [Marasmius fiardii PR-910]|nr:MFS general substrate transporter [Marasmius fiardii PR-910]